MRLANVPVELGLSYAVVDNDVGPVQCVKETFDCRTGTSWGAVGECDSGHDNLISWSRIHEQSLAWSVGTCSDNADSIDITRRWHCANDSDCPTHVDE